jgi:hypothetical protein
MYVSYLMGSTRLCVCLSRDCNEHMMCIVIVVCISLLPTKLIKLYPSKGRMPFFTRLDVFCL